LEQEFTKTVDFLNWLGTLSEDLHDHLRDVWHPSMGRKNRTGKNNRAVLTLILACSTAGVVLGGTASWADSNSCLQESTPSAQCLTKSPMTRTIEGMSVGLVAGLGAALGAVWQAKQTT
jgi:hypothetical protein